MPGNTKCKQDSGRSPVEAHARIPRFFSQWAFHPRPSPSMGDASRGGGRGESSSGARPPAQNEGWEILRQEEEEKRAGIPLPDTACNGWMDGSMCRQQ